MFSSLSLIFQIGCGFKIVFAYEEYAVLPVLEHKLEQAGYKDCDQACQDFIYYFG